MGRAVASQSQRCPCRRGWSQQGTPGATEERPGGFGSGVTRGGGRHECCFCADRLLTACARGEGTLASPTCCDRCLRSPGTSCRGGPGWGAASSPQGGVGTSRAFSDRRPFLSAAAEKAVRPRRQRPVFQGGWFSSVRWPVRSGPAELSFLEQAGRGGSLHFSFKVMMGGGSRSLACKWLLNYNTLLLLDLLCRKQEKQE